MPSSPLHRVGIDPGASGGAAVVYPDGSVLTFSYKDEAGAIAFLTSLKDLPGVSLNIENPGFFFGGPAGNAQAKLHRNVGFWVGAAMALSLGPKLVAPQSWQKAYKTELADLTGRANQPARKRKLKEIAVRLFPTAKVTLATCDALLIALYS